MYDVYIKYVGNFSKIQIKVSDGKILNKLKNRLGYIVENIEYRKWIKSNWVSLITNYGYAPYGSLDFLYNIITVEYKLKCFIDKELIVSIKDYNFLSNIKIKNENIKIRDDQKHAVKYAITHPRCTLIASTSFGKTLVVYYLCMYYLHHNIPVLIIVPTVLLADQLLADFIDYGYTDEIAIFKYGTEKVVKKITVSTYQSFSKNSHLVNNFEALILDEAHKIKASTIKNILKIPNFIKYRTGLTGTLASDSEEYANAIAFLGTPYKVTTTYSLIKSNVVANLSVKIVRVLYPLSIRQQCSFNRLNYLEELSFYEESKDRLKVIVNIAVSMNKTGLIICKKIEMCKKVYSYIREYYPNKIVYQIRGEYNERQDILYKSFSDIKYLIEKETDAILVVGVQVFGTGVSIKNLHYGIMETQTKSYITLLQTIGRGLRLNKDKKDFVFVDILDDIRLSEHDETYAFRFYRKRLSHYANQNFKIEKESINL